LSKDKHHRSFGKEELKTYSERTVGIRPGPALQCCSLIRFADGPAGRRARLVGTGKDVWEIIAAVRDNDGDAAETARYVFMPGSYQRTGADTGRISSALEAKLAEYPGDEDLANGECWL
jgi:hypothetical protein